MEAYRVPIHSSSKRLGEVVPEARVIVAEDADTAAHEIVDAEAAFGWLGSFNDHIGAHILALSSFPSNSGASLRKAHQKAAT
jgi:hypothetical protein